MNRLITERLGPCTQKSVSLNTLASTGLLPFAGLMSSLLTCCIQNRGGGGSQNVNVFGGEAL